MTDITKVPKPTPEYYTYCAGFLFDNEGKRVVLVRKNRPTWQSGKLNAVGGKIEAGESPEQGMSREFFEEAGVTVNDWTRFAVLTGKRWRVFFFVAYSSEIENVQTMTDEPIEVHDVADVPCLETIQNLKWLIPLALDNEPTFARITYR